MTPAPESLPPGRAGRVDEIDLMIDVHREVRAYRDPRHPLVGVFRRVDLIDLSLGLLRYGVSRAQVERIPARFPNAGFHRRLLRLAAG